MQAAGRGGRVGGGWGGVRRYCTGPSGSGRKHRRKRTKDILKYAPFDIDRNAGSGNATRYVIMLTVSGGHGPHPIPLVMKKDTMLTASVPSFIKQGDSLSIGSDHRRRARTAGPAAADARESNDGRSRRRQVHRAGVSKDPLCQI